MPPVTLSAEDRQRAMRVFQTSPNGAQRTHAHILLLLDDGRSTKEAASVTFSRIDEVSEVIRAYADGGLPAVLDLPQMPSAEE